MDNEEAKDEVLHLLTRHVDTLALTFAAAFGEKGFYTEIVKADWVKPHIVLQFMAKEPSSDEIRHIVFATYRKEWGSKPDGLECMWRQAPNNGPLAHGSMTRIVEVHILSSIEKLTELLLTKHSLYKPHVLDQNEWNQWVREQVRFTVPSRDDRAVIWKPSKQIDPGEPIPVVHTGWFKA